MALPGQKLRPYWPGGMTICMESETGKTDGKSYKKWYDENMQGKSILSAEDCYAFRNGMVHQAYPKHNNMSYKRVIFIHPDFTNIISGDNNITQTSHLSNRL